MPTQPVDDTDVVRRSVSQKLAEAEKPVSVGAESVPGGYMIHRS